MFLISKLLPSTNKPRTGFGDVTSFAMGWARRKVPTTGGQNYSLDVLHLPTFSLSGPLNTNARRFNPLEPAHAYDRRQWANVSATKSDSINGQIFSQPLINPDTGGFDKSLMPLNARPFNIFGILPAGQA